MRIVYSTAKIGTLAVVTPLWCSLAVAAPARKPQPRVRPAAQIPPARPILSKQAKRASQAAAQPEANTSAADAAEAGSRETTNREPVVTRIAEAPQPPSAYEQARQEADALRVDSVSIVQQNLATLAGHKVEFKGEVVGFLTSGQGRTLMLSIDKSTAVLALSPQLANDAASMEALRPGATVRVLVEVPAADANASQLAVVAATDEPEPKKLFRDSGTNYSDDSASDTDLIILSPMTGTMPLPPPKPSAPQNAGQRAIQPQRNGRSASGSIESQIGFYKNIIVKHNKKLKPQQVDEIARAILKAGYANNMDPRFLAAVIAVESDFDIYCLSSSGAMGLGQLMPFNLKEAGVRNPWNPTENITGTARLLRGHLDDYKNRSDGTLLAVAAYNAGPGAVRRAGYKVPNGRQVQRYVWKVYYRYKAFAPDMFK